MRFPTLIFDFYTSLTWQDWQLGPGFYLGSHLELSLYLGPLSLNWQFEIEFPPKVKHLLLSDVHFDEFRGKPKYDPFIHKIVIRGDEMDTHRASSFKVHRSPSKGAKW